VSHTIVESVPNNIQSPREEFLNALTHGVGALLSLLGFALLVNVTHQSGDPWGLASVIVFGCSLTLLYTTSTVYHALPVGSLKELFRRFDHMVIYLLIAGTYTMMSLTVLREESIGWVVLGVQWSLAALGITMKSVFGPDRFNLLSTLGYVVMGWMVLLCLDELLLNLPEPALFFLIAGGASYTLGVPFFLMDQSKKFFHSIWHLFVMCGSICHFLMAWSLF